MNAVTAAPADTFQTFATPEHIGFRYRLAGPLPRLLAYLLDVLIRGALIFVVALIAMLVAAIFGFGGFGGVVCSVVLSNSSSQGSCDIRQYFGQISFPRDRLKYVMIVDRDLLSSCSTFSHLMTSEL